MTAIEAIQAVLFEGMEDIPVKNRLPNMFSSGWRRGPRKPSSKLHVYRPRRRLADDEMQLVLAFFMPPEEPLQNAQPKLRTWRPPSQAVERQLEMRLPTEAEFIEEQFTEDHRALESNLVAIHDKLIEVSLHALGDERCSDEIRYEILNWVAHPGFEAGRLLPFSFEACCQATGVDSEEMRVRIKRMFIDEIRRLVSLH